MLTKLDLYQFFQNKPGEQEIGRYLANDLTVFGDVFSRPTGEFISFKELRIDQYNTVDYVVFTSRSQMKIIFVEAKGSDFPFLNSDGSANAEIGKAILQIKQRFAYAKENYWKFRSDIFDIYQSAIAGECPFQATQGKPLLIDPDKDIVWSGAVIAGYEINELKESHTRNLIESGSTPYIEVHSWQSFLRRLVRA